MKNKNIFLGLVIPFLFSACASWSENTKKAEENISVHNVGCYWGYMDDCPVIQLATGEKYDPNFGKLKPPLLNTSIEFEGNVPHGLYSFCMVGTPLLVTNWKFIKADCSK